MHAFKSNLTLYAVEGVFVHELRRTPGNSLRLYSPTTSGVMVNPNARATASAVRLLFLYFR